MSLSSVSKSQEDYAQQLAHDIQLAMPVNVTVDPHVLEDANVRRGFEEGYSYYVSNMEKRDGYFILSEKVQAAARSHSLELTPEMSVGFGYGLLLGAAKNSNPAKLNERAKEKIQKKKGPVVEEDATLDTLVPLIPTVNA